MENRIKGQKKFTSKGISFPNELFSFLQKIAEKEKRPFSWVVCELLNESLKKKWHEKN